MTVKWLKRALYDLSRIALWIERDNPRIARAFVKDIRKKTKRLADFPFMGRAGAYGDIREFVVHKNYLVSYRVRRNVVEVIQVWHIREKR